MLRMSCPLLTLAAITVNAAKLPTADLDESHGNTPPVAADNHLENSRANEVDTADCHRARGSENPNKRARRARKKPTDTNDGNVDQREQEGKKTCNRQDGQPSFPVVLMGIMVAPQNAEHIAFLSDKQSFVIIQPDELAEKVIPIHFDGGDVSSYDEFLDSLMAWGFELVNDPRYPHVNIYKHPMFRKGDWEACLQMKLPGNDEPTGYKSSTTHGLSSSHEHSGQLKMEPLAAHQLPITGAAASVADSDSFKHPPIDAVAHPRCGDTHELLSWTMLEKTSMAAAESRRYLSQYRSVFDPTVAQPSHENMCTARPELQSVLPTYTLLSPSSASQTLVQSAMLEKTCMATAESRRCLSEYRSVFDPTNAQPSYGAFCTARPELQSVLYHKGIRRVSLGASGYQNLGKPSPSISAIGRMGPPSSLSWDGNGLSNAQLQMVTSDVVSAALAALHGSKQRLQPQKLDSSSNKSNFSTSPTPSSSLDGMTEAFLKRRFSTSSAPSPSLDAMTEVFLKRSIARKIQSRQSWTMSHGLRLGGSIHKRKHGVEG